MSTTTRNTKADSNFVARSTVPEISVDASDYSQEHTRYIALLEDYMAKVRAQEDMYVAAGLLCEGMTDFLIKWFHAWEQRSILQLRDCMADDLTYADPTTGGRDWFPGQIEADLYVLMFRLVPDLVFYPQDDTPRGLPYYDFLDGNVRLTVPWRQIGRVRFTPRTMDITGVDRYNMVRDPERGWLIARIDTDADLFYALGQLLPIPIRPPAQRTVERVMRLLQRVFPGLRGPQVRPTVHAKR
ncbi:hypothetical protein AB0N05_09030 [Nocardia sp. NPDC051030]|uniref:hypothetical protein n=1 Tax=Nocardia sp. NPDC051030 TaxID=3155162 RepID=UPI00343DB75D